MTPWGFFLFPARKPFYASLTWVASLALLSTLSACNIPKASEGAKLNRAGEVAVDRNNQRDSLSLATPSTPANSDDATYPTSSFDLTRFSTSDPTSPWVVVNKSLPLNPIDFVPADLVDVISGHELRQIVQPDFDALTSAATTAGVNLTVESAFRDYSHQEKIYNNMVAVYGSEHTDKVSARPGHSEHQTGLTLDFGSSTNPGCNFKACFATTVEGVWLQENAADFGFIVRYGESNTEITGYSAEGWHLRWVGRDLSTYLESQNLTTLEEAFGLSGGWTYQN